MAEIIINNTAPIVRVDKGFLYFAWEETMDIVSYQQSMDWGITVGVEGELDLSELKPDVFNKVLSKLCEIAKRESMQQLIQNLHTVSRQDWRYQST